MDLIYYRGLNCRLASVINIADSLGVNYLDAYSALWSETDFTNEEKYNIYVSKRVFTGLKAIGLRMETLDCDKLKAEKNLLRIPDGEWFLVGMDTFYIPWHPVFGHFHDFHYFFAKKETAHSFLCFDPVYSKINKTIKSRDILFAAFELSRVYKIDAGTPENELSQEAREVLRRHPETKEKLLAEIFRCKGEGKSIVSPLIKQISAMINNRYLFQKYLCNSPSASGHIENCFDGSYFSGWEAVKNGLYKASVVKDNKNVIEEVSALFAGLIHQEINMAKEILVRSS